ncbi:MAG TPA: PRC-barrel domain-containing protein [Verrucomicrobiae bacterium]|nr:PRC-barrel domain-containing protein [Verrucomicrobiae bacterium]
MNKKQIFTYGAIAFLSAGVPHLNAAEAEVKADIDLPKTETRTKVKRELDADATVRSDHSDTSAKVRHSNKASGILGMEVRNRDNQKLGEIKDLVLDVNQGKVSYAVLAVGGFLGVGEKLIALPPSALRAAEDGEYLVLNADKSKIQAAPGFAATSWPSPHDADVDRFWSEIKSTGAPAASEKNRRSSDLEVDVDRDKPSIKSEVNVDKDKKSKIYTDADKDKKIKVEVNKD